MRKNFGSKPWLYPQPVFIIATYGEDGTPDAMNAAWGGLIKNRKRNIRHSFPFSCNFHKMRL